MDRSDLQVTQLTFLPEGSGFFILPSPEPCRHPEHSPPSHIAIPEGQGYKHVCPLCGTVSILTNRGV